ncbi:MAG: class I SAM-dependent methyltransferase [Planctomycetota bacterium]|nr:class I SAM-dependent methyltransferase [Planctomycetota bacterium]
MTAETSAKTRCIAVPCPLCTSDDFDPIHTEETTYFEQPISLRIVRCRKCQMVYTNPRLAEVNMAYEERETLDPQYIEHHMKTKQPVFTQALHRLQSLCPAPARVIDIGCGVGGFLSVARKAGYDVVGIEPSPVDAQHAREELDLIVHDTLFEKAELEANSFDMVTLWDVIEHVENPRGIVRRSAEVLRPGGWVVMRMPGATFHRFKARILGLWAGPSAVVYSPVIHLSFFSSQTIRRLLTEEGFDRIQVRLTPCEWNSSTWIANLLRASWHAGASILARLTGIHLDNLEVYARRVPSNGSKDV